MNNIVAHRGWHNKNIKENTMKAFEMALENNLYGIEFDVKWTKDLVPIIHHDDTCKRVFKSPIRINKIIFSELREKIPEIPTLEEVVDQFGKKIHFFIELKDKEYIAIDKQKVILQNILSPLIAVEDYHFLSLGTRQFKLFNNFPDLAKIFVSEINVRKLSKIALVENYGGITGHYLLFTKKLLAKHHAAGQKVGTGFVKSKKLLIKEQSRGVDWIFTDHPWNLL